MEKIKGKIVLIDDQKYEKELLQAALRKKNWDVQIKYFSDSKSAFEYLKNTNDEIFIIISDINMPQKSGFEIKAEIDREPLLVKKAIPFIFFSTSESSEQIAKAYEYRLQGYFRKPLSVDEQAEQIDIIIKYWIFALHPNKPEN